MNQSEAFKAARARWSSLPVKEAKAAATETEVTMDPDEIQEQVETDQDALHSVVDPEPPGTHHSHIEPSDVGPTVGANAKDKARDEILLRIATALERIADKMSVPSTSTASSSATNDIVQAVQQFSLPTATNQTSVGSAAQVLAVPASNQAASCAAKVSTHPVTIQSSGSKTSQFSAPPNAMPSTSAEGFNYGVLEMDEDSDDEVEPAKRCGVCRGSCEKTFALNCGHFPFCGTCVESMTNKEVSTSFLFKCPYCSKIINEKLELHIYDD